MKEDFLIMKKIIALVLAAMMLLAATAAFAEAAPEEPKPLKLGQVVTYLHGHGFAVVTAVIQGETIVLAKIDEFQFMGDREDLKAVGVPPGAEAVPDRSAKWDTLLWHGRGNLSREKCEG